MPHVRRITGQVGTCNPEHISGNCALTSQSSDKLPSPPWVLPLSRAYSGVPARWGCVALVGPERCSEAPTTRGIGSSCSEQLTSSSSPRCYNYSSRGCALTAKRHSEGRELQHTWRYDSLLWGGMANHVKKQTNSATPTCQSYVRQRREALTPVACKKKTFLYFKEAGCLRVDLEQVLIHLIGQTDHHKIARRPWKLLLLHPAHIAVVSFAPTYV